MLGIWTFFNLESMTAEVYLILMWVEPDRKIAERHGHQPEPCLEVPLCQKLPGNYNELFKFIQTLFGSSLDSSIRLGIINDNPASLVAQLNSELLGEICRISNISPKTWKEEQIQTSSNSSHHWAATMTLSGVAEQVSRAKKDMSTWYLRIWHAFEWYN